MNVVFAGTADVGGGHVAFVVGRVTAEQVRQVGLGCVQLLFACGLAFSGKVRTAQGGVAQAGNQTGGTVDHERFVTVAGFTDGNLVGQREADAVFVGAGQDVAVAFDAQAVTQFLRTGRTVVGGKGQTFVVHRVFRRYAFGDVGFGFVGQVESIIGNTIGIFRTFADFNRTVSRLAEGGLVGVDGVLDVVAVHFFADGNVLTGNDGGGFFGGGELFVQLGDVDGVGGCRTFGYVADSFIAGVDAVGSDVHIACFQTVFAQRHFVADGYAAVVHNGLACGQAVSLQVFSGRNFVNVRTACFVGFDDDVVVAAFYTT